MLRLMTVLCVAALLAMPAAAQDSRYSSNWGTPPSQATAQSGGEGAAQRLVDELERLVDEAEKARAADPVFLRDLRELARRYDWPWTARVVHDDWSDGDATANPVWNATGAPVTVDSRYGLRTPVGIAEAATAAKAGDDKPGDVAARLFGQILRQATKGEQKEDAQQPAVPDFAEFVTTVAISNAFALELDVQANTRPAAGKGRLELGVGQGADALGYRLAADIGAPGGSTLELLRVGARGSTVAERVATNIDLADGATHRLQLTRDRAGGMRLLIDGNVMMELADRAFIDGFDRVVVVNRGGDYTLRAVAAYGVN
jgi:hypothetical protein